MTYIGLGALALLAVLVGYAVPVLIQARRTATAMEEFLRSMTPRIENATSNLDSVLGRADRILKGMEDGTRGITGAMGSLGSFLGNLRPPTAHTAGPSQWLAALSSLLSGLWQAWASLTPRAARPASAAPAAEGGKSHE